MPSTEPSPPPADRSAEGSAIARAARDLDDLTRAYDACSGSLEDAEATVDAVLDDPASHILVVDSDRRVVAMSRGMAAATGSRDQVLGRRLADVVPAAWGDLGAATDGLFARDGWRAVALGGGEGRLWIRRASEDDREAVFVIRYEPAGSPEPEETGSGDDRGGGRERP
jgi:PAS domain-containing protein